MARRTGRERRGERGLTLVEVLIAFAILAMVTLGILALFSYSLGVNMGSLARTDLAYRCERVVETVRVQNTLNQLYLAGKLSWLTSNPHDDTCCPLEAGTYPIPPSGCTTTFWGPVAASDPPYAGAAVTEINPPYTLSYTIAAGPTGRTVTVTAQPMSPGSGGAQYVGSGIFTKAVSYAGELIP